MARANHHRRLSSPYSYRDSHPYIYRGVVALSLTLLLVLPFAGMGRAGLPVEDQDPTSATGAAADSVTDAAADSGVTAATATGVEALPEPLQGAIAAADLPFFNDAETVDNGTGQPGTPDDTQGDGRPALNTTPTGSGTQTTSDGSGTTQTQGTYQPGGPTPYDTEAAAPASGTDYLRTYGARSNLAILQILDRLGLSFEQKARILAPFPVAGPARYTDDWAAPRYNPYPHSHQGVDIFATRGTAVIASTDGVITRFDQNTSVAGNGLKLTAKDSTYFYYAHMDRFALGLSLGAQVTRGQVLGYVGSSGNAEGGPTHLHYEIHPKGGPAVPPVQYLDSWLINAMQIAQSLAGWGFLDQVSTPNPVAAFQPQTSSSITDLRVRAIPRQPLVSRVAAAASAQASSQRQGIHPASVAIVIGLLWMLRMVTGRRRTVYR